MLYVLAPIKKCPCTLIEDVNIFKEYVQALVNQLPVIKRFLCIKMECLVRSLQLRSPTIGD